MGIQVRRAAAPSDDREREQRQSKENLIMHRVPFTVLSISIFHYYSNFFSLCFFAIVK